MQQTVASASLLSSVLYRVVPFAFGRTMRQGRVGIIYSNLTSSFYRGHVLWLRLSKTVAVAVHALKSLLATCCSVSCPSLR
uniref:Putative secreted protein n=1 Tax=Anopheles triannulatus TaxID=58253 RepID=A0A2M4B4J6_9DIPT